MRSDRTAKGKSTLGQIFTACTRDSALAFFSSAYSTEIICMVYIYTYTMRVHTYTHNILDGQAHYTVNFVYES